METVFEIIVARDAPATSILNVNIKIGSRRIFIIPPIVRPIPASFVFPTALTRCPKISPATVGTPPITKTQNR